MDRRTFITRTLAGAAMLAPCRSYGQQPSSPTGPPSLGQLVGRMPVRTSSDITASPLSVGFEVLDRRGFDPQKTYGHLAGLGVKWARCQTGWGRCETQRGIYDFAWLDEIVDALLAINIQPWFNLGYGNRLYTPGAPDEASVGWVPVYDESAMQAWLRYVLALANHFSGRVTHYEIWNEPNHAGFWRPRDPNAADYVRLVERTAPVIRDNVPNAKIIGIACAGLPLNYIIACLREGVAAYIDIISFHPYSARPEEKYAADISNLRLVLDRDSVTCPLWQGENGCPSVGGPGSAGALANLAWDETSQAKWLLRRIVSDLNAELALTSYFHTVDLIGYRGQTNYKGLLRGEDYTPKPAYFAYQRLCALFDADTMALPAVKPADCAFELPASENEKPYSAEEIYHAPFVRGGKLMYAWWYGASLQEPWQAGTFTARITLPEGVSLKTPVLMDPLSGDVFTVPGVNVSGQEVTLTQLPLRDYPLLLADRALIES